MEIGCDVNDNGGGRTHRRAPRRMSAPSWIGSIDDSLPVSEVNVGDDIKSFANSESNLLVSFPAQPLVQRRFSLDFFDENFDGNMFTSSTSRRSSSLDLAPGNAPQSNTHSVDSASPTCSRDDYALNVPTLAAEVAMEIECDVNDNGGDQTHQRPPRRMSAASWIDSIYEPLPVHEIIFGFTCPP